MLIKLPCSCIYLLILSTIPHLVHSHYYIFPLLRYIIASFCHSSHSSFFFGCHTQHLISLSPRLSGFFLFVLMSSSVSIFPPCFSSMLRLLSSIPVVLTSCPAIEGSRGRRGMLILSTQRQSARGETQKRERENVTHLRK